LATLATMEIVLLQPLEVLHPVQEMTLPQSKVNIVHAEDITKRKVGMLSANIGNSYQIDSFIKSSWRQLSDRWRSSNDSSSDADGTSDLDHERGYDRFVQVKCTSPLLGANIREADSCTNI